MTEKEILAQLKFAYESIIDITENADLSQVENVKELETAENAISKIYSELWQKIKDTNDIELYYEEDLLISDCVACDYLTKQCDDYDEQYITHLDLENGAKWWEDCEFLTEF